MSSFKENKKFQNRSSFSEKKINGQLNQYIRAKSYEPNVSIKDLSSLLTQKTSDDSDSELTSNGAYNKSKSYERNSLKLIEEKSIKGVDFNRKQINSSNNSNDEKPPRKSSDSIRMRLYSNSNENNDAITNSSSSSDSLKEELPNSLKINKFLPFLMIRPKKESEKQSHKMFIVFILFIINLLNFIDRYTLAGVLKETQNYFKINDSESGLLQTAFICSYMLLAPVFGYLGDRYKRKWIIVFGVSFWSTCTLLGSFVPPDKFWIFLILRGLVGIGEASYSCIAPTLIGDLFTDQTRTKMLAVFYLAVPVGSGLGYIVGSSISNALNDWRWAMRFTPPLGFVCVVLLTFFVREPKRGGAEGSVVYEENKASLAKDIVYLFKNKTFTWVTLGFTFASFVLGGVSWWVPLYVEYAIYSKNLIPEHIPLYFGVVTCFAGLLGVSLSSLTAPKFRSLKANADALVCAVGSLIAVPSLFILILITRTDHIIIFWGFSALAITSLCLSWTLVSDILLYTIHPNKRSIASAFNILICHLFGDAGSPYIIGAISDSLRKGKADSYLIRFSSLQTALYLAPLFATLSFVSYLFAAIYLENDKKIVDALIKKNQNLVNNQNDLSQESQEKNEDDAEDPETNFISPSVYQSGNVLINENKVQKKNSQIINMSLKATKNKF